MHPVDIFPTAMDSESRFDRYREEFDNSIGIIIRGQLACDSSRKSRGMIPFRNDFLQT